MKNFLLRALLPLFLILHILAGMLPRPSLSVNADTALPSQGDYACILSDSAFFYNIPDERRGLFLLPKTYYVRLLEYGADYCKIEYLYDDSYAKKITGYAKTADLTFVDYVPKKPYLYHVFDVDYRLENTDETDDSFLTEITVTCVYYGDYKIGSENWCYVLRGSEFGYIPKPSTLFFEENTEYEDRLATANQNSASDGDPAVRKKSSSTPAQIAILIALCLLVPVLAALILKPPRRPPYEEE